MADDTLRELSRPRPGATIPVRFLASVTDAGEALDALRGGADIVDAKNPAEGALGALPADAVRAIRAALPRRVPVSATIGDGPADAEAWIAGARAMAAAGADVVKIGLFPGGDAGRAIEAVGAAELGRARLVGVVVADRPGGGPLAPALFAALAAAGFLGVMLDTADKDARPLPELLGRDRLAGFLAEARRHGLATGLAGSLRLGHVAAMAALGPDILGFRGALCAGGLRTAPLDPGRVGAVREALDRAQSRRLETTTA